MTRRLKYRERDAKNNNFFVPNSKQKLCVIHDIDSDVAKNEPCVRKSVAVDSFERGFPCFGPKTC